MLFRRPRKSAYSKQELYILDQLTSGEKSADQLVQASRMGWGVPAKKVHEILAGLDDKNLIAGRLVYEESTGLPRRLFRLMPNAIEYLRGASGIIEMMDVRGASRINRGRLRALAYSTVAVAPLAIIGRIFEPSGVLALLWATCTFAAAQGGHWLGFKHWKKQEGLLEEGKEP